MADLDHRSRRLPVGRPHAFGMFERERERLLLIHMLARLERMNEVLRVQMLRRGDDDRIDALVVEQAAMIVINGRARNQIARVIEALVVNVRKRGDLNVRAGDGLMEQLRATLSGADNAYANALVRTEHTAGGGQRGGQAGSHRSDEFAA